MADSGSDDKTEKASSQKLRKSREQGQVARSKDWAGAIGLLISARMLVWLAPGYLEDFRTLFALALTPLTGTDTLENLWSTAFSTALMLFLKMLAPLAGIPLAIIAASIIPGGWVLSFEHLKPNFAKLSPLGYFERLHKPRHFAELGITLAKASVLCVVLWHSMHTQYADFVALQAQPLPVAIAHGAEKMMDAILALCMVIFIFALCDLPLQKLLFLREQRMSKRELKEEYKSSEGSPEIRQRIRQLQNQIARGSIRKSVPNANVVIVNPEHYAVALKYDESKASAPFVIAKGIDEMAFYIRKIATLHDIEVIALPPLARAIYNTSQVNQQIPAQLYRAVAQVLSYVLQLQAFRGGRRKTHPALPDALPVPKQFLTDPAEAE
jgi:flagellar biosynthetic protein FlhB